MGFPNDLHRTANVCRLPVEPLSIAPLGQPEMEEEDGHTHRQHNDNAASTMLDEASLSSQAAGEEANRRTSTDGLTQWSNQNRNLHNDAYSLEETDPSYGGFLGETPCRTRQGSSISVRKSRPASKDRGHWRGAQMTPAEAMAYKIPLDDEEDEEEPPPQNELPPSPEMENQVTPTPLYHPSPAQGFLPASFERHTLYFLPFLLRPTLTPTPVDTVRADLTQASLRVHRSGVRLPTSSNMSQAPTKAPRKKNALNEHRRRKNSLRLVLRSWTTPML